MAGTTYERSIFLGVDLTLTFALFENTNVRRTLAIERVRIVCVDQSNPQLRYVFDSDDTDHQAFFNYTEPDKLVLALGHSSLQAGKKYYCELYVFDSEGNVILYSSKVGDPSLDSLVLNIVATHQSEGVVPVNQADFEN